MKAQSTKSDIYVKDAGEIQRLEQTLNESSSAKADWSVSRIISSPVTLGLLLFLILNLVLLVMQPFTRVNARALPAVHTWTWWAAQEYFSYKPPPQVVLLGSSLFMHSVSRQDANYLGKDLDYVKHHRSNYLEYLLQSRFRSKEQIVCFNFSLPGDLVSDNYMIMRSLFRDQNCPQYVIIGLSIRDFIDNAVNCPGTTPPFRYLKRFSDIDDLVTLAYPQIWQRFDYQFGKACFLWQKKLDLQVILDEQTKQIVRPLILPFSSASQLNDLDYRHHVPTNLHSEVEEGMAIVKPNIPNSFDPNYADYKRRCGKPNLPMFQIQSTFLDKLLTVANERKIKPILLNMPLTPENLALMPPGSYERYLDCLRTMAKSHNVPLVDLNGDSRFTHSDFYDTAHMNASGGRKLLDALAQLDYIQL